MEKEDKFFVGRRTTEKEKEEKMMDKEIEFSKIGPSGPKKNSGPSLVEIASSKGYGYR